jgi:predicted small integral membrane protein
MRYLILLTLMLSPDLAMAQNQTSGAVLQWMAWTWPTAAFFGTIAVALAVMGVWEAFQPGGSPRLPGLFGINTTRGDRLFISLLSAAYIHLGWLALLSGPLWGATLISVIWMLAVFRWV